MKPRRMEAGRTRLRTVMAGIGAFGHTPLHERTSHRPRDPVRGLWYPAMAGIPGELSETALAADLRSDPDAGNGAARARRRIRAADRGLQPGASVPDRRTAPRGRG